MPYTKRSNRNYKDFSSDEEDTGGDGNLRPGQDVMIREVGSGFHKGGENFDNDEDLSFHSPPNPGSDEQHLTGNQEVQKRKFSQGFRLTPKDTFHCGEGSEEAQNGNRETVPTDFRAFSSATRGPHNNDIPAPPIVTAQNVEDYEDDQRQKLQKEEDRLRRNERCCLLGTVMVGLLVNTILIAAVLLAGYCLIGTEASCFKRERESPLLTGMTNPPMTTSPSEASTTISPTQSPPPRTLMPFPSVPVSLPVSYPGEIDRPIPRMSQRPSLSPLRQDQTLYPTFHPRTECDGRYSRVACRSNGSFCDRNYRTPATRQCSIGTALREVAFSFHPFPCNQYGTSQSSDTSSCFEELLESARTGSSLMRNPVDVTCSNVITGESLTVTPSRAIPISSKFTIRPSNAESILPDSIQCTIADRVADIQQVVTVDTSGNVTLSLGDLFGSMKLVSCVRDTASRVELSCLRRLDYNWTIFNERPNVLLRKANMTLVGFYDTDVFEFPSIMKLDALKHFRNPLPQSTSTSTVISVEVNVCEHDEVEATFEMEAMDPFLSDFVCYDELFNRYVAFNIPVFRVISNETTNFSVTADAGIGHGHGHGPLPPPPVSAPTPRMPSSILPTFSPFTLLSEAPTAVPNSAIVPTTTESQIDSKRRIAILAASAIAAILLDAALIVFLWKCYQRIKHKEPLPREKDSLSADGKGSDETH